MLTRVYEEYLEARDDALDRDWIESPLLMIRPPDIEKFRDLLISVYGPLEKSFFFFCCLTKEMRM